VVKVFNPLVVRPRIWSEVINATWVDVNAAAFVLLSAPICVEVSPAIASVLKAARLVAPNAFRLAVESARTWSEVNFDALAVLRDDICDAVSPSTVLATKDVRRVVFRAAKLEADIRAI
jgi:hypothetical protein